MAEKKKILVIDDDEISLDITAYILNDEYDVSVAKSGIEALDYLLHGYVPDLLLLDILMPEMDGWETYKKIRGISLLKDVPISFLTSISDITEEKRAFQMGVDDFIKKPFTQTELMERVKILLEKKSK